MFKVKRITQTGFACPSQWKGITDQGKYLYIRYRYGELSAQVDGRTEYLQTLGDCLDGVMSLNEAQAHIGFYF